MATDVKSSSTGAGGTARAESGASELPLIPLSVIDAPTQRVYVASAFVAVQTYKLYRFFVSLWSQEDDLLLGTFLLLDFLFIVAVSRLRTPRLDYRRSRWTVIFALLSLTDWLLTGGWRSALSFIGSVPILGWIADGLINTWTDTFNRQLTISEHRVRLRDLVHPSHHILGQHTIHVLPYSTAAFSPSKSTSSLASCFCLNTDHQKSELSIPIIFNNTEPQFLSYSISPFDSVADSDKQVFNVTIPKSALIRLNGGESGPGNGREDSIDLELDDADDDDESFSETRALIRRGEAQALQRSADRGGQGDARKGRKEVMYHLTIKRPGRVRLERVLDRNRFDARLSRSEILIVECPKMGFARKADADHYCPGDHASVDVWVNGLAPLEMSYAAYKEDRASRGGQHDRPEVFKISHISSSDFVTPLAADAERADQLALALRGSHSQQKQTLEWAASRNVSLPITLDTSRPGRQSYRLESVRDACGNAFEADERSSRLLQTINVHRRPSISFEGCSPDRPLNLLQGGPPRQVAVRVDEDMTDDGPFEVEVHYEGNEDSWQRNVTLNRRATIDVDAPGTYSLKHARGKYCTGEVGAKWMCSAVLVPPPTASIEFDPIRDPCAGSVGVKALAVFSGKPPFRVKYQIARQGRPTQEHEQIVQRTREEIEFRPSTEGEITYTFTGLSDANYVNLPLDGPSFTQVLHPVAKASFENAGRKDGEADVVLHSCQGNVVQRTINFEGVGPFELQYAIRSMGGDLLATRTLRDVRSIVAPLDVEVPKELAAKGGMFIVTLTSVKDAKGCDRPLTVPDLTIEARKTKPSVAFVEPRETAMLEGKEARLPIRLAGDGPWTVHYRRQGSSEVLEVQSSNVETSIVVSAPGVYEIMDVQDRHCPGDVQKDGQSHSVSVRPRPQARFETSGSLTASGGIIHPPVCLGDADSAALDVQGHFPVSVSYRHQPPDGQGASFGFNSAQNRTSIQLTTNREGKHTYELQQIGDAVYAPAAIERGAKLIRLEHLVHPLPFANFVYSPTPAKRVSLCLGEALKGGKHKEGAIPTVSLSGTPPFTLEYAVKDALGVTRNTIMKSDIRTKEYDLHIVPSDFPLDGVGKWSVDLVRIVDGNGCERTLSGADAQGRSTTDKSSSMDVEVVESANISPVGTRSDYCVGETIDFVLQGSPPWTVDYTFQGRVSRANIKTTTFSRIAEQPGVLRVEAIAHQHNRCQTTVREKAGMVKTIHALPSVHIREGAHFVEDLREGNLAEISFRLQGEPPFSFTYQRTQAVDRYTRPQVLEAHTITGIEERTYTITTAEEGTWSVIWLQDKWCAVSIDMAAGKATSQGEARKMIAQSGGGVGTAKRKR